MIVVGKSLCFHCNEVGVETKDTPHSKRDDTTSTHALTLVVHWLSSSSVFVILDAVSRRKFHKIFRLIFIRCVVMFDDIHKIFRRYYAVESSQNYIVSIVEYLIPKMQRQSNCKEIVQR